MEEGRRFVGVDVAKARLDVFIQPSGESFSVANDERGIPVSCLGDLSPLTL
jgi:hypothetical protein